MFDKKKKNCMNFWALGENFAQDAEVQYKLKT